MRQRPAALFICTLLFLYFPIEFASKLIKGGDFHAFEAMLSLGLPLILVIGLIRVSRIGWYTLVTFVALWGIEDLYQYYQRHSSNLSPLLVHLAIYFVSLAYFINPRVRTLYFDPKMRWWRTKPRYETHLPSILQAQAQAPEQWHYPVLRNISEGGCFVETSHFLDVNSRLEVAIPLPVPLNVSVIKAEGEVRWVSTNPLRQGMGIQFLNPPPAVEKALRGFVAKQL
jgi:hypothetical protein